MVVARALVILSGQCRLDTTHLGSSTNKAYWNFACDLLISCTTDPDHLRSSTLRNRGQIYAYGYHSPREGGVSLPLYGRLALLHSCSSP